MGDMKGALRSSCQACRVSSVMTTLISALILRDLFRPQHGSPCQLQVSGTHGGQERGLEELLSGLEGGVDKIKYFDCVDHMVGSLVPIWLHLRNGCECPFRCSVVTLANVRCQALVGVRKGSLETFWRACRVESTLSTL